MLSYIIPVLIFAVLGILAGTLLTVASKVFEVKTDERIEAAAAALPQINCGSCGYSGCSDYAEAVVTKGAPCTACKPGGSQTAAKLAEIMGISAQEVESEVAFVRCKGDCNVTKHKYVFDGVPSCAASNRFFNGSKECSSGCLGYGDCVKVCPRNAISIIDRIAVIDPAVCIGCGLCAKECPNNLIVVRRASQVFETACSSIDPGKITRKTCKVGCIGCGICMRKCPEKAITVSENHASIDYSKCSGCGICQQSCPMKAIVNLSAQS